MPESVYSPSYDSPEPEEPPPSWKWNHFEVRTLLCLIIKGEHKISKDPMDLTDKLNHALNPSSTGGQTDYSRDIPHAEVQAMLKRILSKKLHAVDLSERDFSTPVTRTKLNAFMRNLGFDGGKDEWDRGRKQRARVETQNRLVRYMVRKEGGRPSPRSRDERDRRRMLLREPRARRLLRGWGIGASFWEDEPKGENHPLTSDENRDLNSARYSHNTKNVLCPPLGPSHVGHNDFVHTADARDSVAMWAGGFASTAATPQMGAIASQFMPIMPGPDSAQQDPMLDYEAFGGFASLENLQQQQPYQRTWGEQNGAWGANGAQAGDQPPNGSQHVGRGF